MLTTVAHFSISEELIKTAIRDRFFFAAVVPGSEFGMEKKKSLGSRLDP
jgi:hypothetical protein